jgi:hypothetical protein
MKINTRRHVIWELSRAVPAHNILADSHHHLVMDLEADAPPAATSSWSLRHPEKPIIAPRPTQTAPSEARKASNRVKQQQRQDTNDALTAHLSENAATQDAFIIDTAKTFNVTSKYIRGLMTSKSLHKSARAVSWQNAMVHHKSQEVNEGMILIYECNILISGLFVGLEEGRKKKLTEIRALIIEDTELQNSSEAQKKELLAKLTLHRQTSKQGARFNNAAAAADFRGTLKKSLEEVRGVSFCSHVPYSTHQSLTTSKNGRAPIPLPSQRAATSTTHSKLRGSIQKGQLTSRQRSWGCQRQTLPRSLSCGLSLERMVRLIYCRPLLSLTSPSQDRRPSRHFQPFELTALR